MKNKDVEKVLQTEQSESGIVFENYPVYVYDGEKHYLMRDEILADEIESRIPEDIRHAIKIDCNLIPAFQAEPENDPPTDAEKKILKWLDEFPSPQP